MFTAFFCSSPSSLACYSDSDLSLKSWNNNLMTQGSVSFGIRNLRAALIEAQTLSWNNSATMEDVLGVRWESQGN